MKLALCVLAVLSACQTAPPLATRSGKPEILIESCTPKAASDAIVAYMSEKGFRMQQANDYLLVFSKADERLGAQLLMGSEWNPTPDARVTYTLAPEGDGVRVFVAGEYVTNPGTGFERRSDMTTGKTAHDFQSLLERIRDRATSSNAVAVGPPAQ